MALHFKGHNQNRLFVKIAKMMNEIRWKFMRILIWICRTVSLDYLDDTTGACDRPVCFFG